MSAVGGDDRDDYTHVVAPMATSPEIAAAFQPALDAAMKIAEPKPIYVIDKVPLLGNTVEPQARDVILCTYPDTLDGWLAAWVVRDVARTHALHVEFQLIKHGVGATLPSLDDRNWIAIGGTGPWSDLTFAHVRGILAVGVDGGVDPLPFAKWERSIPFGVKRMMVGQRSRLHTNHCLAGQMWDFFKASRKGFEKRPRLIDYVEDEKSTLNFRDTILTCVESYPRDFKTLDALVEACDDRRRRENMIVAGQAIRRYAAQQAVPEK